MPLEELRMEIAKEKSKVWNWFHPSSALQQWLEDRLLFPVDYDYYGDVGSEP